jgi:hypothetical protein
MSRYFRFVFEKGSSHTCPGCGVPKKFSRYTDLESGELLPEQYGKCNRVEKCGYHLNPYRDGYLRKVNYSSGVSGSPKPGIKTRSSGTYFIPNDVLKNTLHCYDHNLFIQNLKHKVPYPFLPEDVDHVCRLYLLGSIPTGYMRGATTFPFIDEKAMVRFIQVKLFDSLNHTIRTDSLASMLERQYLSKDENMPSWPAQRPATPKWLQEYSLNDLKVSCLFGAHLLPLFPENRIALVEAPKTAIYGTLYFGLPKGSDDLLWLAVYSRDTLNVAKCQVLKGRKVYLFPDLSKDGSTYQKWQRQAEEIQRTVPGLRIVVSDLLEKIANRESRNKGEDLADLLSQCDWRPFRKPEGSHELPIEEMTESEFKTSINLPSIPKEVAEFISLRYTVDSEPIENQDWSHAESGQFKMLGYIPGAWDADLLELEYYFSHLMEASAFPATPLKIGNHPPIHNLLGYIRMNLETAKAQSGNPTFKPYLDRLLQLREYLLLAESEK